RLLRFLMALSLLLTACCGRMDTTPTTPSVLVEVHIVTDDEDALINETGTIWYDDFDIQFEYTGQVPPNNFELGTHTIKLEFDGYEEISQEIDITEEDLGTILEVYFEL
ncbi:MAG: PEGA domain-containing protein, partial [Verrucomicrobiota bacterium]